MSIRKICLWTVPVLTMMSSCVPIEDGAQGYDAARPNVKKKGSDYRPQYGQPMTAVRGVGQVTVKEGARVVSVLRTTSPNIERTRFIEEQNQIVVKSRGSHGPATVELFDSRSGRRLGTVKAFELAGGGPTWAAGMAD